jgi:hypothetical protein
MRKLIRWLALVMILGLVGCYASQPKADVAVEITKVSTMSVLSDATAEDFMGSIAGVHGRLSWKSFVMDGEKNPAVKIVQADVLTEKEKKLKVLWEVNIETKATDLVYIGIDGEGQESLATGLAALYLLSIGYE